MKKLIYTALIVLISFTALHAQDLQADTARYVYCELVGTQQLNAKFAIRVDFGQERNAWRAERLKDEQTGKVKLFNSMIDALNYMAQDGWEFVQAYVVPDTQGTETHWVLKKKELKKGT